MILRFWVGFTLSILIWPIIGITLILLLDQLARALR